MALLVDSEVDPLVAGLVGSISTADGATAEQLTVLTAVAHHVLGREGLDVTDRASAARAGSGELLGSAIERRSALNGVRR